MVQFTVYICELHFDDFLVQFVYVLQVSAEVPQSGKSEVATGFSAFRVVLNHVGSAVYESLVFSEAGACGSEFLAAHIANYRFFTHN